MPGQGFVEAWVRDLEVRMGWLMIERDLTLWQNLRLRCWLLGMDLLAPLYRGRWATGWGGRAYLHCVAEAGALSYGEPERGPDGGPYPWPEDL